MLLAAYLIEAGIVLIVTPWTGFWTGNYFAQSWPWLGSIMFDPYVRGAITGVGLITALGGLREFVGAFLARRASADIPPRPLEPPRP